MKLRLWEAGCPVSEIHVSQQVVRLGRDPDGDVVIDAAKFPKVSALHAELQFQGRALKVIPRSRSNRTLVNNAPIDGETIVRSGDRIRLGFTGPEVEIVSLPSTGSERVVEHRKSRHIEPSDTPAATIMAGKAADYVSQAPATDGFLIGQGGIIGRDSQHATYVLDHPHVSRVHARLTVAGDQTRLADLGSANGTFCNGVRVSAPRILVVGDTIDIGPFSLVFDGKALDGRSRADNVQLVVSNVGYVVPDAVNRRPLSLLHQVELVLNPGEFLCILGPSGSGKSTLLNIISGRRPPSTGQVYVNSRNLHKHFEALKQDLAVVPQSSVMHDTLTVEQSFGFTSELRLPSDLSREELQATVDGALRTVGLEQRRTVRISQLSGGQLKRAGLGGELLSEPSLLFLDEVTSGLDEHSDGEMMRLFRSLADAGKTLVCITHNLTHVEENCHLIAVLTVGGRLAFYGQPADAKRYFRIDKLADIYVKLQTQPAERWAEQFRAQPQFAAYIGSRKPDISQVDTPGLHEAGRQSRSSVLRQFLVLLRRTIAIWRGDKSALAAFFGQALLVSLLLGLVFGNIADIPAGNAIERLGKIRNLLFLVSVSCFWLGCNNSVKEIVKERPIYRRERDFNLIPEAYLLSKLVFLSAIGVAQSIMLGCIALGWFEMPGGLAEKLLALVALSIAGTALGLAISSISKSEEIAVAIVPIVVIPQIILAGVVATLPSTADWLARIGITVYWGQKGIEQALPEVDRIASGFEPGYPFSLGVVILHAVVFLSVAWFGVRWKR